MTKYRFVQEARPDGDIVYYTEYFSDLGNWIYVGLSLSYSREQGHKIFERIKANTQPKSIVTILEE